MKRRISNFLAFLTVWCLVASAFPPIASSSEGEWVSQNSGVSSTLLGVSIQNDDKAVIVGAGGTVLTTSNGGQFWFDQERVGSTLHSVSSAPDGTTFAVGDSGIIVKMNGPSWEVLRACKLAPCTEESPEEVVETATLRSVHALTSQNALAVGDDGTIVATSDGDSWSQRTSGTTRDLRSIWMVDSRLGWAVGSDGTILHTVSGGVSWLQQAACTEPRSECTRASEDSIRHALHAVTFVNETHGYITGANGLILTTTDGGKVWRRAETPTDFDLNSISFSGATGVAVGAGGTVLKTVNGGHSWNHSPLCSTDRTCDLDSAGRIHAPLHAVRLASPTSGYIVGDSGLIYAAGTSLGETAPNPEPTSGSLVWEKQATDVSTNLQDISFPTQMDGYASGTDGSLLSSKDGGRTWTQIFICRDQTDCAATSGSRYNIPLTGVDFQNDVEGYAVGGSGHIFRTYDAGVTWTRQFACRSTVDLTCDEDSRDQVTTNLRDVASRGSYKATAVGADGTIVATEDGTTWHQQASGTTNQLHAVSFSTAEDGVAVGAQGTVLRTTDGGKSWTPIAVCQKSDTPCTLLSPARIESDLRSVTFTSPSHGFIAGENGTILATKDGGSTWSTQRSGTTQTLFGVHAFGSSVYAVGAGGTIVVTADGGSIWRSQPACLSSSACEPGSADRVSDTLHAVAQLGNGSVVVAGANGTILRKSGSNEQPPPTIPSPAPSPTPTSIVPAPSPSPSPADDARASSEISIRFKPRRALVGGLVSSPVEACTAHRMVKVKKLRHGKDRLIGKVLATDDGRWSLSVNGKKGRFYAVAVKQTQGATLCLRAKSQAVTVRT